MTVGDVVRTDSGRIRRVTSLIRGPRGTAYRLAPLPGGMGRQSTAEVVHLVRSWELVAVHNAVRSGRRRHEEGYEHGVVLAERLAVANLAGARRRGEDDPGELRVAADAVSTLSRLLTGGAS